ncbi:MAG: general secretion pathway protein GspD [Pseudomonadales bacterium]|nr:general secretion pathway protein GspD [Pseudomonadales bacterium]
MSPWRMKIIVNSMPGLRSALKHLLTGLLILTWVTGCSTIEVEPFPEPVRPPKQIAENARGEVNSSGQVNARGQINSSGETDSAQKKNEVQFSKAPRTTITRTSAAGLADSLGAGLSGEDISVSFNEVPLVVFINEVFGNELGLSFFISPNLKTQQDLVTLRLTEPLPPSQLFSAARTVLTEYGIAIKDVNGILTFQSSQDSSRTSVPLLISGRTLPEVPTSHREIFQLVPLQVVRNTSVTGWIRQALGPNTLKVLEDPERNAVVLRGAPELVAQAVQMIQVLDQPVIKGTNSIIIEPVFIEADDLAKELDKIMKAEGYQTNVSSPGGSSVLLPLVDANKLLVFAGSTKVLAHIKEWVKVLDEERKDNIKNAIFTYQVQNTQAEELKNTLNLILGNAGIGAGQLSGSGGNRASGRSTGSGAPGSGNSVNAASGAGLVVVDKNSNTLIFQGSGNDWGHILEVIVKLDKAVPSVLIEVLIAEITLGVDEGTGFEFLFNSGLDRFGVKGGTLDALGASSKGLSFTLDSAGATRAVLNLFHDDSRVSIRSSPKLMVKSGETAVIEVGNEIPVITQNSLADSTEGGTSDILQEISYRKTGILLSINPIVQANGLVDLDISQELSEARPTESTSLAGSPTILNRKVETSLTLRDGGSLLMGGMISNSQSTGQTGVPGLSKIPLFGRLFRSDSYQQDRTELIILVIPYVVSDHKEGWELTKLFKEQLELYKKAYTQ